MSRHPEVKWAQRSDKVYLTVLLPDAKNAKVNLDPEGVFTFSANAGSTDNLYEIKLELHDKVNVEESKINIGPRSIFCILQKAEEGWWNKLLRGAGKPPHYVKVDWDKWVDEDEDTGAGPGDMDMGGMDFSNFGAGGMGGPGGMDGFEDSDDEDFGPPYGSASIPRNIDLSRLRIPTPSEMEVMSHSSSFLLPVIPNDGRPPPVYALIVLNQNLPRFAPLLWNHSRLHMCADGGANHVYDEMPLLFPDEDANVVRTRYRPDVIKGDMDSIREEVLNFYVSLGTKVIDESDDQDTTDLHKCISYIRDFSPNLVKSNLRILVTGALGGRFDHEAGNINVLYRFSSMQIVLLCDDCLIQLLPKSHHHEIHIQSSIEGPHCGLVPIGMPSAKTTTTGLQWDLSDTAMRFGGLVSTSNIVKGEKVTVQSDSDLLWTISLRKQS